MMADEPRHETGHTGDHRAVFARELADVLVDITVVQTKLDDLGDRLALALPASPRRNCARLVAIAGDTLNQLDDTAAGRMER
jgi:hypothetical protein